MKNYKNVIAIAIGVLMGIGVAQASDVYIEQTGGNTVINITQTGTANRVGSSGTATTFDGDTITIDIVQTGSTNEADLQMIGATSSIIDYTATGDFNILDVSINGGTGNKLTAVTTGDSNRLTMCGTNDGAGSVPGATATCATGIAVNNTTNIVNVTGSTNAINLALASAGATNTINVGQNTISDSNVINLTQTGVDTHIVTMSVDGNGNKINITQQ